MTAATEADEAHTDAPGDDAEYRAAQLTLLRLRHKRDNPGLAEALGLSGSEAEALFQLMAENQMRVTAEHLARMSAAGDDPSAMSDAVLRRFATSEDPLRAALGESRYAQYQEYVRNVRPALTQLADISNTLASARLPLTASQSRSLRDALLAEYRRQAQDTQAQASDGGTGTSRRTSDFLLEIQTRQEESNRRMLEASMPHLSSAQVEVLREQLEAQARSRRKAIALASELETLKTPP